MAYSGWIVGDWPRAYLMTRFRPKYAIKKGTHITLQIDPEDFEFPIDAMANVVGYADDGHGLECLVVEVDGSIYRPDGGIYHITWSVAEGRAAKESNDVLATQGFVRLDDQFEFPVRAFYSDGEQYITTPLTGM